MRIIPKKTKVKNTVFHSWSLIDIIVALVLFVIIFLFITMGNWIAAIVFGVILVGLMMPTQDGILYTILIENIKFLVMPKSYKLDTPSRKSIKALVPIKAIDEYGVIEYANGTYGVVLKIGQKNFGIEDGYSQETDIQFFENVFKFLDLNQSADIVKIDRPITFDGFSHDLFEQLQALPQDEPDKRMRVIKNEILTERIDAIDELNSEELQYLTDFYFVVYGRSKEDLNNTARSMVGEISKAGLESWVLGMRETAVFIKYTFSHEFDEREVNKVADEDLVAWALPEKLEFNSKGYKVDGIEAAVMCVADYPLRVRNAWGAGFCDIPNTKTVIHMKPVEQFKAIKRIDKCMGEMAAKYSTAEKASESNEADTHMQTMGELLNNLQTDNEILLDTTVTITAYNYLGSPNFKKDVRKYLLTDNFKMSNLSGLQIDGFRSACPTPDAKLGKYERGINSSTLSAVFPFVRTFVMDRGGVMLGSNAANDYPFIFNMWKRGNLYQNSNAMVIGKSGSGKSFFMKTLIANEWSNGTRVIILDPENEYVNMTHNMYGNSIDVGNSKEGRINPFHIYKILSEDGSPAEPQVTFNTHLKTLESFFKIVFEGASSDVLELINSLVVETYNSRGITENTDCSNLSPEQFPTFSDLLNVIDSKNMNQFDEYTQKDMRTAKLYVQKFVTGRYSDIWNAPSTMNASSSIIDFNFQSLFANKNNIVANAQMLLVFRYIEQEIINARERNRSGDSVRTMIIVDEAHLFIDAKYPIALDFFFSMSKRIRKYNGSFIPATQNISDWNASEETRNKTTAIIKNSQYLFIFKLSAPDVQDLIELYGSGESFNDEEQRRIITATTGEAFFIGSTEFRTCVDIEAGDYARSLFDEPTGESYGVNYNSLSA